MLFPTLWRRIDDIAKESAESLDAHEFPDAMPHGLVDPIDGAEDADLAVEMDEIRR
jgi:hypothetical protein